MSCLTKTTCQSKKWKEPKLWPLLCQSFHAPSDSTHPLNNCVNLKAGIFSIILIPNDWEILELSVIYYYFTTSHSFPLEKGGFAKEALLYRRYRHSCIALWYTQYKEELREATKVNRLYQWVPCGVEVERLPCNPRVSGSLPGAGNLKKLFIWMKIHGLTQNSYTLQIYPL